jgi:hypothetical protein
MGADRTPADRNRGHDERNPMRVCTLAGAGLAAVLLAACSGNSGTTPDAAAGGTATGSTSAPATHAGNGEAAKNGPRVAADAADALVQAGAVHLVGTGTSDGQPLSMDLHLQGTDVTGTVTMAGQPVEITSTAGKTYMKAPAAFWTAQQVPASAARTLDGRWVLVPAEAGSPFEEFALTKLADHLRTPDSTTWQPGVQKGSYQGRDVVVITESDGSTTQVAATGTPYPLHADDRGSDPGTVTLSDFGVTVPIAAPPSPLDLSTLGA